MYPGRWYFIEEREDLSVFVDTDRVTLLLLTWGTNGAGGGGVAILPSHRMLTLLTLGEGCLMLSLSPSLPTTGAISLTEDVSRSDRESGKMLLLSESSLKRTCSSLALKEGAIEGVQEWAREGAWDEVREWPLRSLGSTPDTAEDAADVMLLNLE